MTKLSVNINKIATLRNSRGGNLPDLLKVARDVQIFGAEGITVHPRPDQRHIRYRDVYDLKPIVTTELNVEGNPISNFMDLVLEVRPTQVTLVPDSEEVITSNKGWDTISHQHFLKEIVDTLKESGIRTSIFVDPEPDILQAAAKTGTDRIELFTEAYAHHFQKGDKKYVEKYHHAAAIAQDLGMGVNAGHDLNLDNLAYFKKNVPFLKEVSIGHALIGESIYLGIENVIRLYQNRLK